MDIADSLLKEGIEVDRRNILLEEPIKSLGVFTVPIKLTPEVEGKLKVWVVRA
jgi:large subunit ribosomal protein L9